MEAAGTSLRAQGFGQRCRKGILCQPAKLNSFHRQPRRLHASAAPGTGPAAGSSGDVNETLAPVVFRFTDSTSSAAVNPSSSASSAQGATWTGILSTSGGSGSVVPLDAAPRVSPTATSNLASASSIVAPPSTRPSHDVAQECTPSSNSSEPTSNYSDFYRKTNTTFQHSRDAPIEPANGWSHSSPAALPPSHTLPSGSTSSNAGVTSPSTFSLTDSSSSPGGEAHSNGTAAALPAGSSSSAPDSAEVAAALARAQAALERAETSLDDIQRLSSDLNAAALESLRLGAPPSRWSRIFAVARGAALLGGLSFAMLASHAFGLVVQWAGATLGAAMIAGWGRRRGALAPSGAVAAFVVGCGTLGSSLRFGATLIAFFLSSSKLTSYKEELKEGLEESAKKGGQRSWVQVLCNGLVPTILAVVYGVLAGCVDLPLGPPTTAAAAAAAAATGPALEPWRAAVLTGLMGGFLGYYSCCCGDTWASELGPLSADTPRLITTMRPVRRGTNGGVTLLGLSASIMGGMFVGLVFYLAGLLSPTLWIFESQRAMAAGQWRLIPLGLMAGLFGSVLDSVLGATLQYSGYDRKTGRISSRPGPDVVHISGLRLLDNNAVNAASATITSALTALVAMKTFGF